MADMTRRQAGKATPNAPEMMLDTELQAHIGRQLRSVYDEVLNEAVPDRFLKLLEDLERMQSGLS